MADSTIPPTTRLDQMERHLTDAMNQLTTIGDTVAQATKLQGAVGKLTSQVRQLRTEVNQLEARFNLRFPPQWNCPKCKRVMSKDSTNCGHCGTVVAPVQYL